MQQQEQQPAPLVEAQATAPVAPLDGRGPGVPAPGQEGPGKWVVLAGQTGGGEKGDYAPDLAAQVGSALKRIIKLLGEAGAGPEHIVRLTWYLTSRSEYEAAGAGIGAAWKETLGRSCPPSTLH